MRGEIAMSEARAAAFAAHAAEHAAARAAGHAAATAHFADHAAVAANYAVTATRDAAPTDSAVAAAKERDRQYRRLPKHLRLAAFPDRGND